MKTKLFFICSLLFVIRVNAQEINFEHNSWAEIKAKAKAEKKLIFMDAYTSWCGPCKAMAKNTFTNPEVSGYYNSNFVNAKIDMEKGEGLEIAKQYKVSCYPNLLYIDGDGNLVHRAAGYLDAGEFMALAKTAQTPDKTFSSMQKQYERGNTNAAFMNEYLKNLSQSCLSANDAAIKYFASVKENEMLLPANWRILNNYIEDIKAAPFIYLVKNRAAFAVKYTIDSVNTKIFYVYLNEGYKRVFATNKADSTALYKFKKEIANIGFERTEELNLSIDLPYYQETGNWNNYFKTCKTIIEKYKQKDAGFMNNVCWTLYEKSNDKAQLAEVEKWAKKATEIAPEWAFLDTYACLLFKNGKKQEAIATEKKAIDLAVAAKQDTKDLEETLKKFEGKN